ncbi:MAG TPA: zinc-dependent alcohol dehydrogenase family protein [Candidatus Binataceae bacterium]|jgi:NADPH:quinone reductase-like Zn-dependent oxidoreductase|nr:zinc-dependent alcohol dehydrogenase family protein [Candidatus Binataceae bacterium]
MRRLQLVAHGKPLDVIELNTVSQPAPGPEDVLVSMEAAPLNPSDFLLVRGIYGVRPAFPFSLGSEGVGRVIQTGSKVDVALRGKRILILPTYEQGTWADQVVVPARNIVPMSDQADPVQLSMIGINPATAYLLLNRYVSLMPGDWIGQTAANSAMGQYIIAIAKLAGVKTLNVVRRKEAAEQVRQLGGDRVVLQGDNLNKDIEEALGGKKLSLVLDTVGGTPVGELAKSLKTGGSIVSYALETGQFPVFSIDFLFRGLSHHGFWLINWIRNAPRTEIQDIYQKLGDLVAEGSLSAAVEHVYPLEQFKEAIQQSLKSNRSGKVLFKFGDRP